MASGLCCPVSHGVPRDLKGIQPSKPSSSAGPSQGSLCELHPASHWIDSDQGAPCTAQFMPARPTWITTMASRCHPTPRPHHQSPHSSYNPAVSCMSILMGKSHVSRQIQTQLCRVPRVKFKLRTPSPTAWLSYIFHHSISTAPWKVSI